MFNNSKHSLKHVLFCSVLVDDRRDIVFKVSNKCVTWCKCQVVVIKKLVSYTGLELGDDFSEMNTQNKSSISPQNHTIDPLLLQARALCWRTRA